MPKTPQQKRVVKIKNRTIQEMAQVMLKSGNIPTKFLIEAINNACCISN